MFRLGANRGSDAGRSLRFQAHLHLLHAEALQAGQALLDAGHGLNTSAQFHLENDEEVSTHLGKDFWLVLAAPASGSFLGHLGDVMGAKVVDQLVKPSLVLRGVDFRELLQCTVELSVQPRSAAHSVAISNGTPDHLRRAGMSEVRRRLTPVFEASPTLSLLTCRTRRTCCGW